MKGIFKSILRLNFKNRLIGFNIYILPKVKKFLSCILQQGQILITSLRHSQIGFLAPIKTSYKKQEVKFFNLCALI